MATSTMDRDQRRARALDMRNGTPFERRTFTAQGLDLREDGNGQLSLNGWASVTGVAYDMGWYQETIARGAFQKTLREAPDVQLLINHEGLPLARTVSGTLSLREDDRGLAVTATLDPNDVDVQRLAPKVARGDIDQMSFAFRAPKSTWNDEWDERTITELSIHRGDVSVVNYGANPHTTFDMRDLADVDPDELRTFVLAEARTRWGAAADDVHDLVARLLAGDDDTIARVSTLRGSAPAEGGMDRAAAALLADHLRRRR